jgi:hypothetical protein
MTVLLLLRLDAVIGRLTNDVQFPALAGQIVNG